MEDLKKMVLLIDADNTQLSKLEAVIREISVYGRIVVKRAYGNWRKDGLRKWEDELKRLAIKAEQQFDYVTGKNATDMALVIDAINLLHTGLYDGFAIVSSDSDFTPLAINLHESGVFVFGVGERQTPESFRNSCDEFILLENLEKTRKETPKKAAKETAKDSRDTKGRQKAASNTPSKNSDATAKKKAAKAVTEKNDSLVGQYPAFTESPSAAGGNRTGEPASSGAYAPAARAAADLFTEMTGTAVSAPDPEYSGEVTPESSIEKELEEIHELLHLHWEKNQDEDGFAYVSSAGTYMKRVIPDFDPRSYGFEKLSKLLQAFPNKYELKRTGTGKNVTVEYRCKED